MGRKLNVALLLTVHLSFIACAVLIVGPLMTESGDQVNQNGNTMATNSSESFVQVSAYTKQQKSRMGERQEEPTDQQKRLSPPFTQQQEYPWARVDEKPREGPRWRLRGFTP